MTKFVLGFLGLLFALGCVFFGWYTVRLLYINLTNSAIASHRQSGMYIGFVAFPLTTLAFAWLSLRCFKQSRARKEA